MSEQDGHTDTTAGDDEQGSGTLSGPGAGLSATGRTADQLSPGEAGTGTAYGDPGGTGTAEDEVEGSGSDGGVEPADG